MDDNRVLKAWDTLTPEQQDAMTQRWGSAMAWYLCKYTNTIATGLRDGMDASELARHYKIPMESVKLAGEVAKGSVIPDKNAPQTTTPSPTPEESDLPPGAVQGPIIPPAPPAPDPEPEAPKTKASKRKPPASARAHVETVEESDKEIFANLEQEMKEAAKPKKKKRGRPRKKKAEEPKEEAIPEPVQEEAKPEGPPPFHPNAKIDPWVKEGDSGIQKKEQPSPFHPKAQVNPMPGQKSGNVPPEYEKSKSYAVIKTKEDHELR